MSRLLDRRRARLIPIALAQAIGLTCGVASVRINSHLVPPAVLGVYGIFLTLAPIGCWVVHAGLIKSIGRHWAAAADRGALLRALVGRWARRLPWLALFAAPAGAVVAGTAPDLALPFALALFASASLWSLATLGQTALQAEAAHWRDCGVSLLGSLSRTLLPPLLFVAASAAPAALWAGFALHALVLAIAVGAWLRPTWRRKPEVAHAAPTVMLDPVYTGPLFTALALSTWVLAGMNRWLVAWRFGPETAGYFTLASSAAVTLASVIGTVWLQYFQPGLYALGDKAGDHGTALARRVDLIALLYLATGGGALAVLTAIAPWLVGPLINPGYRASLAWIAPAGCFGLATILGVFYHTLLLGGRRERACAPVDLGTAAVLIAGSLAGALAGESALRLCLLASPAVPCLLTRTLARRFLFRPAARPAPAPGR